MQINKTDARNALIILAVATGISWVIVGLYVFFGTVKLENLV